MDKIKANIKDILLITLTLITISLFMYNLKIKKDLDKSSTIAANYIVKDLNHAANIYFKTKKTNKIKNEVFKQLDSITTNENNKTIINIKQNIEKMNKLITSEDKEILIKKVNKNTNEDKKTFSIKKQIQQEK